MSGNLGSGFFPIAADARTEVVTNTTVSQEINLLQQYVIAGIEAGVLNATVTNQSNITINGFTITGTPMTANNNVGYHFYNVSQGAVIDNLAQAELNQVTNFFTLSGYNIYITTQDNQTITWNLGW